MLDRLLRVENLAVVGLLLVAGFVALGARWRNDPRHAGAARAISITIRAAFIALVVAIVAFFAVVLVLAPIAQ